MHRYTNFLLDVCFVKCSILNRSASVASQRHTHGHSLEQPVTAFGEHKGQKWVLTPQYWIGNIHTNWCELKVCYSILVTLFSLDPLRHLLLASDFSTVTLLYPKPCLCPFPQHSHQLTVLLLTWELSRINDSVIPGLGADWDHLTP